MATNWWDVLAAERATVTRHLMDLFKRGHPGQAETTYVQWAQETETKLAGQSRSAEEYRANVQREVAVRTAAAKQVEAEAEAQRVAQAKAHAAQQELAAAHARARAEAAAASDVIEPAEFRVMFAEMARPYLPDLKALRELARTQPDMVDSKLRLELDQVMITSLALMEPSKAQAPLPQGTPPRRAFLASFKKKFDQYRSTLAILNERAEKVARDKEEHSRRAREAAEAAAAAEDKRQLSLLMGAASALTRVCKRARPETALDVARPAASAAGGASAGGGSTGAGTGSQQLPLWRPSEAEVARVAAAFPGYAEAVGGALRAAP